MDVPPDLESLRIPRNIWIAVTGLGLPAQHHAEYLIESVGITTMEHEMTIDDKREGVSIWKTVIVLTAVAAGMALAWKLGLFELLTVENIDRLDAWFSGLGIWAPVVFILLWIAACVFFLPGLPISIAGGLIFGAVWGTVWTTVGANLGAAAAFLIGRYAARGMIERRIEDNASLRKIDDGVRNQGWRMLMITRLVPLFPFNIQNYVYGLTDIRFTTYVVVSLVCMLPGTIAYNFAAGSVRTGDFGKTLTYLAVAAVCFVALSLIPGWIRKRYGTENVDG
jgi:uncharacterized membrane protein YdjX (TVP38/TMEM64 family)